MFLNSSLHPLRSDPSMPRAPSQLGDGDRVGDMEDSASGRQDEPVPQGTATHREGDQTGDTGGRLRVQPEEPQASFTDDQWLNKSMEKELGHTPGYLPLIYKTKAEVNNCK